MDKAAFIPLLPALLGASGLYSAYTAAKALPTLRRDIGSGSWGDAAGTGLGIAASALGARFGLGGRFGTGLAKRVPRALAGRGLGTTARVYSGVARVPRAVNTLGTRTVRNVLAPVRRYTAARAIYGSGMRAQAAQLASAGRPLAAAGAAARAVAPSIVGAVRPGKVLGIGTITAANMYQPGYTREYPYQAIGAPAQQPTALSPVRLFNYNNQAGAQAPGGVAWR